MDPAQAAQLQLQQQLISAGVDLGTAAINAGVDIGTHLIDKIVEVGTYAMDTVAASTDKALDKAIPELIHPGSTTGGGNSTGGGTNPSTSGGMFDFGGGTGKPTTPAPGTGPGAVIPPAQNGAATAGKPDAAPEPSGQPGVTGGMALPPPASGDQEHKPREGQLGVTVPTSMENVPAAVIGDFGDDTL
jgi:hypothetical protein